MAELLKSFNKNRYQTANSVKLHFLKGKRSGSYSLTNALFDRKKDPNQLANHFYDPEYTQIKDSLKKLTYSWMEKYNDKFYEVDESMSIRPVETWMYNYKKVRMSCLGKITK